MTTGDINQLLAIAFWTVGVVAAPGVFAAMVVGTFIALLQAVTQVQEITLTFVPKIIAVLIALMVSSSLIGSALYKLTEESYSHIAVAPR